MPSPARRAGWVRVYRDGAWSACADADRLEQRRFETVERCPHGEIGAQSARLEAAFEKPVAAFAAKLKGEQFASGDDLALHAADLDDAVDPADPVAHALDLHDDVDRAGDLGAYRPQWQIDAGHQHHVLEPSDRIARRVGMDRR